MPASRTVTRADTDAHYTITTAMPTSRTDSNTCWHRCADTETLPNKNMQDLNNTHYPFYLKCLNKHILWPHTDKELRERRMGCLPEGARDAYRSHDNALDQTVVRLFTTRSLHLRQMNCTIKLHGMSKVTYFFRFSFYMHQCLACSGD